VAVDITELGEVKRIFYRASHSRRLQQTTAASKDLDSLTLTEMTRRRFRFRPNDVGIFGDDNVGLSDIDRPPVESYRNAHRQ